MRLKKLILFGFKSFADKTILEFSPGITGIVGPNGCGKSNISDAFRWVLGEQSAKSMRGSKMPDVIFSGTSNRPPVNFAEVTVVLCNADGSLPIEYSEVAVTRRLHRDGESEYLINNKQVRLKDVQELFLDSGVGKNTFSIFEQGKIDQVIQYSPLERRYIFEEAAGILRFLQRKKEALRKLEQTDLNTSRVKDIYSEVENQIKTLEKQAEKAKIYKENKAKLEKAEKTLFIVKWDNLEKRLADYSKKEIDQKQQQSAIQRQIELLINELHNAKQQLAQKDKTLRMKSEALFEAKNAKEIRLREKSSQNERLKESSAKAKQWQDELHTIKNRQQQYSDSKIELKAEQEKSEKKVKQLEEQLLKQRKKTEQLEQAVHQLRSQQQTSQQERLHLLKTETHLESEIQQNKIRQESMHERKDSLEQRKGKLSLAISEHGKQVAEKEKDFAQASSVLDTQKETYALQEKKLQQLQQKFQHHKVEQEGILQEFAETKARHKVLSKLRDENEGFSTGSKKLLQESSNPKSPLYQVLKGLYEFITPKKGHESALASVLRHYTQTLVVERKGQLQTVLDFAKQHKIKDFSLLCLETISQNRSDKLSKESIVDYAQTDPLAIHFLNNISAVDSIDAALNSGNSSWVNNEFFLDIHGVLFYSTPSENNVFLREAELKKLETRIGELEALKVKNESDLKQLIAEREQTQSEKNSLDKTIRQSEMKQIEINFSLQRLKSDLDRALIEEKQISNEQQLLDKQLKEIAARLADNIDRHAVIKGKNNEIIKQHSSLEKELEQQTSLLKQETTELHSIDAAFRKSTEEFKKINHELQIIDVKDLESEQRKQRLQEEIKESQDFQEKIKANSNEVDKGIVDSEKSLLEAATICSELEQDLLAQKGIIETIEGRIQESRERLGKTEEECYKVSVHKTQTQSAAKAIVENLNEQYQSTIDQVRAEILPPGAVLDKTSDQLERAVNALRKEIDNAGDINMTSIEEFEKSKTRYQFLGDQLGDLETSQSELLQIIAELDTESRKIFKETFDAIRANFQKNFKILFNGGEADLQFTEAEEILDAGIEIIAKPPGKQMRSISLMSGGEKCLTAMALLFAIFEVKPAPFCILDEIDAPLDDSNVQRFLSVVKQFIERCQFIIITHNKRTMAIADVLCGVSMEERGVSKMLAIEFSKQKQEPLLQTA